VYPKQFPKMPRLLGALYAAGHKPFDLTIERLVALLRVSLTLFCFVDLLIAPELQIYNRADFELVLVAYAVFGLIVAWLPTFGKIRTGWQLPVHVIDIGVISYLMYFLQSFSSTFFALYVFILLGATFRWHWRGAIWTTASVVALETILFLTDIAFTHFLIQCAFLLIIGGMFAFFGIGYERGADRLNQIAAWPNIDIQAQTASDGHWLDASLAHIANVLQVPRVLVVWAVDQEPYVFMTLWADGKCRQDPVTEDIDGSLVAADLRLETFASEDVELNECFTATSPTRDVDQIISKALQSRFKISSVCSAPFSSYNCSGRLFLLDRSNWGQDYLALADIAAARLCIQLEYYAVCARLEDNAAIRERIRLSRDLHDGTLQSLAAAALQLKIIADHSDGKLGDDLDAIRRLIGNEQRRIRAFVDGRQPSPSQQPIKMRNAIRRSIKNLEQQWGCIIKLQSVKPQDAAVANETLQQIEFLIAEAVANAVQHGEASQVNLAIELTPSEIQMRIADNGHGLSGILGAYNHTELVALAIGPQSILKRITELRGTLSLVSSRNGLELEISFGCKDSGENSREDKVHAVG
jgi:signal transduction histidine kinase